MTSPVPKAKAGWHRSVLPGQAVKGGYGQISKDIFSEGRGIPEAGGGSAGGQLDLWFVLFDQRLSTGTRCCPSLRSDLKNYLLASFICQKPIRPSPKHQLMKAYLYHVMKNKGSLAVL